jgi:hypothetical protein
MAVLDRGISPPFCWETPGVRHFWPLQRILYTDCYSCLPTVSATRVAVSQSRATQVNRINALFSLWRVTVSILRRVLLLFPWQFPAD